MCVCALACKCRYKPRFIGEDAAVGSRSGEEQLQSCSSGEIDQSHESRCSARHVHTHTHGHKNKHLYFYDIKSISKPTVSMDFLATGPVPKVPNGCTGAVLVSFGSAGTQGVGLAVVNNAEWLCKQCTALQTVQRKYKRQKYETPTCHEYHKSLFICLF